MISQVDIDAWSDWPAEEPRTVLSGSLAEPIVIAPIDSFGLLRIFAEMAWADAAKANKSKH